MVAIIPGKMVKKKKLKSMEEPKPIFPKVFSPVIEFRKGSSEAIVKFRLKKKSKAIENYVDSESVDESDLKWVRYSGRVISNYHRREDGTYIFSGVEAHQRLNQRLEGLFFKAMSDYFGK